MKSFDTLLLTLLLLVTAAGVAKDFLPSAPPAPQVQAEQRWEYKQLLIEAAFDSEVDQVAAQVDETFPLSSRIGTTGDAKKHFEVDEEQLASLGEEGWELVAAVPATETAYTNFGDSQYVTGLQPNVRPGSVTLLFKRPLVGATPAAALLPQSETVPSETPSKRSAELSSTPTVTEPGKQQSDGAELFALTCSGCHGANNGGGIGPAIGGYTNIHTFRDAVRYGQGSRELSPTMPRFSESQLSESDLQAIYSYLNP